MSASACGLLAQVIPVLLLVVSVQGTGVLYQQASWSRAWKVCTAFYVVLFLTGESLAVVGGTRSEGIPFNEKSSVWEVMSVMLIWLSFGSLVSLIMLDMITKVWATKGEE